MKVLVINCGSSSIKYKLFGMQTQAVLAEGIVERVGATLGTVTHSINPGQKNARQIVADVSVPDHGCGLERVVDGITHPEYGVIRSPSEIDAVGHRVVHGGEFFRAPTIIDSGVIEKIETVVPLAPLHNPGNIEGIAVARRLFPHVPQVAVFDTAFHQSMPEHAYRYALPRSLYTQFGVRRYGFHGTSHQYASRVAADMLGVPLDQTRLITLHLGSGCSVAAVLGGRSVDTSMGMTPLAGVVMGTRCGDIDPGIHSYLEKRIPMDGAAIEDMLNRQSGLRGICGDNDMRDIHRRRKQGDSSAELAFEMFAYSVKKYIGAYAAALGAVDALVFTAGVGENDPLTREACCAGLEMLGIEIDKIKNRAPGSKPRKVHSAESRTAILVIPANEELEIARQTVRVVEIDKQLP